MQMTSREFNQDTARAKREAENEPVFITDRGRRTHVLLTIEAYERLALQHKSIADFMYYPGAENVDLPLPPREIHVPKGVDWSE